MGFALKWSALLNDAGRNDAARPIEVANDAQADRLAAGHRPLDERARPAAGVVVSG